MCKPITKPQSLASRLADLRHFYRNSDARLFSVEAVHAAEMHDMGAKAFNMASIVRHLRTYNEIGDCTGNPIPWPRRA